MNRRWPSPTFAASSGSSSNFRIALGQGLRVVLGHPHDVLPRSQLEAREVVGAHDGDDRNAGRHHLEAGGAETEVVEVVALHVGGGHVRGHDVFGDLAGGDDLVAHAELVGDLEERVVEHVSHDDHDDVVALAQEIGERADQRDAVALERDDVPDRQDHLPVVGCSSDSRAAARSMTDEPSGIDTHHDVREAFVGDVVAGADVAVDEPVDEHDVRAVERR